MLVPTRTKYRKRQRGRNKGKATKGHKIDFGEFGLAAITTGNITNRQIEAARITMTRYTKRTGKLWIRIFPDFPFTKKPAETRMGKGKGNPEGWFVKIKPGRVLFEIAGVNRDDAKKAMLMAGHKLPVKVKFFERDGVE
jgi:large subunit ribosomal protein L16